MDKIFPVKKKQSGANESRRLLEKNPLDEDILDGGDIKDKLDNMDGIHTVDDVEKLEQEKKGIFDSSCRLEKKKQ